MKLSPIDLAVIATYAIGIISIALWVSRPQKGHSRDTQDYFLAGKSLPWWAIGASLIAANISAEQIIGMSGSGYLIGLGIATYEWMAAITLLIVGKWLLPIFLRHRIYTMPQFLEERYDHSVRMIMAVFWLGLYVLVNLTSILWLGALAMNAVAGVPLGWGMLILGGLAVTYSLYGGLKAVAFTDIIQVVLLIFGGMMVTWLALGQVGGGNGPGAVWDGFAILQERLDDKFDMILSKDNPYYKDLPGLSVLLGGMWMMNLSYWGFNQYIIQRALAAKSLGEAQKGIVFAAWLKILMPIIVVVPGIAAIIVLGPGLERPDAAYPSLMGLLPVGIKGLVFAALIAAILSSLGSMMNSISTIFTMDIFRHFRPHTAEGRLVLIGRTVSLSAIIIAMLVARPLLGQFDQAFQYIQEFTGFFTPGIVVLFLLGMFWRRANVAGALSAALGSFVLSALCWKFWPALPFIDRVGLVFLCCAALAVLVSLLTAPPGDDKPVNLGALSFGTSRSFNVAALGVVAVVSALYITWW